MALSKRDLFQKRRMRVRSKLRKVNTGKARLSVHRSSKNIQVQLIDDVAGKTLASASTLEKDLGEARPWLLPRRSRRTSAFSARTLSKPRRRSGRPSPNVRRWQASKKPISTVAAFSTTAGSRRWRMLRARPG